jgi:hypothetical protein
MWTNRIQRYIFSALGAARGLLLDEEVVDVAVAPILTRFEGADHRMLRRVIVLGRVAVLRIVAAADVAALKAEAQVDPGVAYREAVFAAFGRVRAVLASFEEMLAEACPDAHESRLRLTGAHRPTGGSGGRGIA